MLSPRGNCRAALEVELFAALALLCVAVLPLAWAYSAQSKRAVNLYRRAVAVEIVDGEMEKLVAGEWKAFPKGARPFPVDAESAKILPPGEFVLTVAGKNIRLEWLPRAPAARGRIVREAVLR